MVISKSDSSLIEKINQLKKKHNAIILVHNYQRAEVQDIGDLVGDSLELSQKAAKTDAAVIVFCGVHFMAETAAILSPHKKVLLPNLNAGCPMADMITAERLREEKKKYPDAVVVCYVNSSAEVKAESDICCTSANAVNVVKSLPQKEILFIPDQFLGHFVASKVPDRIFHFWPGYCPTHAKITPEHILIRKKEYPDARVVVHPECKPEVIALADEALSTSAMIRFAKQEEFRVLIVGTETELLYRLRKENPGKTFVPATEMAVCPNMKLINLERVLWSLEDLAPEVKIPEDIRLRALGAVDKMIAIGAAR
jgi:quinolinate synthase